ncbi:aldo/keto reductase [Rhodococcus sp. WS4]|nr:aldo/keto reductase [Rhodococcus sp. WS4]
MNFFDAADVYGQGASEEILGKLVADCRDDVVIASKVFYPTGPDVNAQGLSRRHIVRAVEAGLTRLGTDRLDLCFVHAFDENTRIEQTLRALDDLQRQGKILPLAEAENLGVITYSPLGAGLLTGKYGAERRPDSGRLVDNARYADRYGPDSDLATADRTDRTETLKSTRT